MRDDSILWMQFLKGVAPLEDIRHVVASIDVDHDYAGLKTVRVQLLKGAVLAGRGEISEEQFRRFLLYAAAKPISLELLDWIAANPAKMVAG